MAGKINLCVPIRIDGLYVETEGLTFRPPMADFSNLPHYLVDGSPQNTNKPNLAESVFDQSNDSLSFPKGLHVHWALPDALTTGQHRGGSAVFPAVPNRWLVRRLDNAGTLQKSMIVESDFLHSCDKNGEPTYQQPPAGIADWTPITFPTKRQLVNNKPGAAFRYMGRNLSLAEWLIPSTGNDYLNQRDGNSNATQQAQDPIYSAIRALAQLDGMTVLSQALGGFNAALMTRKQVLQIPIENPLEGDLVPQSLFHDLNLTARVAQAVGKHHPMAPLASKVCSPIRSGTLTLESLSLNDTFGQQWNAPLKGARLVTSNGLADPDLGANTTYLPPRLSTAARLNFRWLAALSGQNGIDEVEMNSAPVTTSICGWLLPNNFDNSLMVYDNTGKALGSINVLGEWMPAPGSSDRIAAAEIPNSHLRRLIRGLVVDPGKSASEIKLRQDFLAGFLSTLDSAMEAIEPASFAQHEALALLIGRPIAVVRARIDLQLMGQPTNCEMIDDPTITGGQAIRLKQSLHWKAFVDQDWGVFAYDWGKFYGCTYDQIVVDQSCPFIEQPNNDDYARTTHGFEKVVIPMRLGEHQLLNDGLVGFWKEMADGEFDNVFHAPQTLDDLKISEDVTFKEGRTTPCIRAYVDGVTDNLSLTLQDDPLGLTILMDPRGVIHATSGILPVSQLEIPAAYYADALKHMGVTFRVSPLLTDAEELHAALPKEAGYVWSWITQPNGSIWEEIGVIAEATEHVHFFKPPKIVEGWLKLTPKNQSEEEH